MDAATYDYVIAGGGLAGGLIALALAADRPGTRLALVEEDGRLGGNHTWSFHDTDVAPDVRHWLDPVVAHRWRGHTVRFPEATRELSGEYATITAPRFDDVVRGRCEAAGFDVVCGTRLATIGADAVTTTGGRTLRAPVVLDARGWDPGMPVRGGYQKFVGVEVELVADAPAAFAAQPLLMDATVPQDDGFRFVYVLPFTARRLLVEDTYYSGSPALDRSLLRARLDAYLAERGLAVRSVVREESGVLPLPFAVPGRRPAGSPFAVGARGGWFHPLTGYSLPVAVRVAAAVAAAPGPAYVGEALGALWRAYVRQARFCARLTRLMFAAVPPERRWELLARFYRLPADTIGRFYALKMTWRDRLRLVAGRPPRGLSVGAVLFAEAAR